VIAYTGNSAYCYASSLHMCLAVAGLVDEIAEIEGAFVAAVRRA